MFFSIGFLPNFSRGRSIIMDHFVFVFLNSRLVVRRRTKGNENNFSLLPSGQFTLTPPPQKGVWFGRTALTSSQAAARVVIIPPGFSVGSDAALDKHKEVREHP